MSDSQTPSPTFAQAVGRGFRSLGDLGGRDTRPQFWLYAGAVLVTGFVIGNIGMFMALVMGSKTAAGESGGQVTWVFLGVAALMAALFIALLAAAVTRRLHDRDRSGIWALPPVVLLCSGLVFFGLLSSTDDEPGAALFLLGFINNLLYFAALLALVVQLAMPGTSGDNRFGPAERRR